MKVIINDQVIETDKIQIEFEDGHYEIRDTPPAYKDQGRIDVYKQDYENSSTISISPCVTNHIRIK